MYNEECTIKYKMQNKTMCNEKFKKCVRGCVNVLRVHLLAFSFNTMTTYIFMA
jgi:hypothetical protein